MTNLTNTEYAEPGLEDLVSRLGEQLLSRKESIVTAESCTGGWVSMLITSIAGCSTWFDRGFVTYSNEAKQEMLGVDRQTIEIHGAVSEETARYMVQGAVKHSNAQAGLSVTGIAGPGGGSIDKPVGTVCFGWVIDGQCETETCHFSGDRQEIREQSVRYVIAGMLARVETKE
jgi:nicotinamide-nucleotide amidase